MEIKKGERYKCIKDFKMFDGEICFTKGNVYESKADHYLINDNNSNHHLVGYFGDFFKNENTTERPSHYGGDENPHEPIKIIQHYGLSFELGNVIKYVLRSDKKGCREDDLKKAMQYLQFEIDKNK